MSYQVTIEPTGEQIEVEEGQTILEAALRQGVWLPFACGHGTCATCKCQVLEGEVDLGAASSFALMDMERDEGKVLACCAIPQSDLVIEADIDVDPDFAGLPVQDYRAVVTQLVELSPTIRGVHLKLDRPMAFQAGQYVNLQLAGIEGTRAFSWPTRHSGPTRWSCTCACWKVAWPPGTSTSSSRLAIRWSCPAHTGSSSCAARSRVT